MAGRALVEGNIVFSAWFLINNESGPAAITLPTNRLRNSVVLWEDALKNERAELIIPSITS